MDSFTCCSFNILAPCYKRLNRRGYTEDDDPAAWRKRNELIFQCLLDLNCDIVCLQEVWFNKTFLQLLRHTFDPLYAIHLMQRPHKEDGLAIFIKLSRFESIAVHERDFKCVGQRVGLAVHIRSIETKEEFLVANTHLTFPHHEFDYRLRCDQIRNFSAHLAVKHREHAPKARMIVCGDFNLCSTPSKDNVYQHLTAELGLRSAFFEVHGREPGVTHLTHNNHSFCVDFIFVDKQMAAKHSYVYPSHLPDEKWGPEFTLSDHRPIVSVLTAMPKVTLPADVQPEQNHDSACD